jgi:outer membrane protein
MTDEFGSPIKKPLNIGLILSIISLLGVVFLFIRDYSDSNKNEEQFKANRRPSLSGGSNSIVFVNSDLILEKYELVNKLSKQLEEEKSQKDADFTNKQHAYEKDAAYFQEQVQKQTISESSAQEIYEKLMLQQQDLYKLQDQYSSELSKKEYEMNVTLLDSVRNFLNRMNQIYNYDYILGYNSTGNIFFAQDTFDITNQVIEGLNREYQAQNELPE